MLPPLLPCCSLDYLDRQLLNQLFFVCVFFSFRPSLPRFPHGVYNSCAVSCASSPLLRPLQSRPRSRSRSHPCPRSHLRYCSRFRPRYRPRSHPVFVHGSPPPSPFPFPFPPRRRSRLCFHCVPPFASTHVIVPAPSPSPSPFTSSFPPPTPFPSPFPPPTPIQPPSSFVPSGRSNVVAPSVRCACTETGPCERSCRVCVYVCVCIY